jgi:hypothetical protein
MLDDAKALWWRARSLLKLADDAPTSLEGQSFGGLIAISGLSRDVNWFDGVLITSGICQFEVSENNVNLSAPALPATPIAHLVDPFQGIYKLRIFGSEKNSSERMNYCSARLASPKPIYFTHFSDDTEAPFQALQPMIKSQGANTNISLFSQNKGGHVSFLDKLYISDHSLVVNIVGNYLSKIEKNAKVK